MRNTHHSFRFIKHNIQSRRFLFPLVWSLLFLLIIIWQISAVDRLISFKSNYYYPPKPIPALRKIVFNITEFGAVGDGKTVNTKAFQKAVETIKRNGGGQLNVLRGEWLTGPFNLTSRFTMFLDQGAVILGIQVVISLKSNYYYSRKPIPVLCKIAFNITDVGDGKTVNTKAFERAIKEISKQGGGQLNVLKGVWITGPFNLTGRFTLFLDQGAVFGVDDENLWPLMPPLPSYGVGRESPGPRYGSLIHGQNLQDVVITGYNGTIDGQGQTWWEKYRKKLLKHTRGPLVQIMWSRDIHISDITLRNSPFWTLHPYDCNNVTIRNVTILAPSSNAPNTDGIDPDSCVNMVIEDCYISVGDDGIAIKSGWDQYGIAYGRPSANILIRNLVVRSTISAGVSIGSEMSGGISNITIENLHVWDSKRAVRIKTSAGRGGYVSNITYRNLTFYHVRVGVVIKTDYNEHPDEGYDPKALPVIENISFTGIRGQGVRIPVRIYGSKEIPVRNVTFQDVLVGITYKKKRIFQCSYVQGRVIGTIFPAPCENLDVYDELGRLVKHSVQQNSSDIDYEF